MELNCQVSDAPPVQPVPHGEIGHKTDIFFIFPFAEFKGIINWQSKIWRLVSDYILMKTSGSFQEVSPQLIKQHEEKIFEFRNHFLKEVTNILDAFQRHLFSTNILWNLHKNFY